MPTTSLVLPCEGQEIENSTPGCGKRLAVAHTARLYGRFLGALAAHDQPTAEHSLRVRRYALWLAEELRLTRREKQQLSLAALMHDVGKVCLPESLLNKPGKLSMEEYSLVQVHPLVSEMMLRPLAPGVTTLAAVRWHHERPDGRGYPDGLRGMDIPLAARILAVADSFDAMTSWRPYHTAMSWPEAREAMLFGAGSQFDFEVVECFARMLRRYCHGR